MSHNEEVNRESINTIEYTELDCTMVKLSGRSNMVAMSKWCQDEFGKRTWSGGWFDEPNKPIRRWTIESRNGGIYFKFRDITDATLFMLRWCDG